MACAYLDEEEEEDPKGSGHETKKDTPRKGSQQRWEEQVRKDVTEKEECRRKTQQQLQLQEDERQTDGFVARWATYSGNAEGVEKNAPVCCVSKF
jgi:hypothetical protein